LLTLPVSRFQKSLRSSAMIPSASWGIVFKKKNQQLSTLLFAEDQVIIADTEGNLQRAAHKVNQIITFCL